MSKKFNTINEMLEGLSEEQKFEEVTKKQIEGKQISKFLTLLRCRERLTQKQIAKKIGCTQSKISKIETSFDNELSISDLIDYAKALNLKLELGYRKSSVKIVDLIKYHASKISKYLNQLVDLAKDKKDDDIAEGVDRFLGEAVYNMIRISVEPYAKLLKAKNIRKKEKQMIHISPPFDSIENLSKDTQKNPDKKEGIGNI